MGIRRRGWALAEFWLAWTLMLGMLLTVEAAMQAQTTPAIAITQVSDIVYRADGTPAGGTVLISWPAFSTLSGASVPAGSTSVTIGAGGVLSVGLAANAGSTPMGSYYTVVYHLNDGSVTREYWVVPVSTATVAVSAIRSTVLPASVAMQTVSKSYVDTQIAQALGGSPLDSSAYVQKSGDTMTGPLVLPGDPTAPLQASDKNYVDVQIAGVTGGGGQKVSLLPQATQIVTQPAGTELAVNDLNSVLYASQYVSGAGNNGIANATASCTAGCDVVAEQTYPAAEVSAPTTWSNQTHVDDRRGGVDFESFLNPLPPQTPGFNAAKTINVDSTQSAQSVLAATGGSEIFSSGMVISSNALAGGSNTFPSLIQGTVPYFKTTFNGLTLNGTNYTVGQHNLFDETQNCYGVGDCLMGGMFMQASGGFRDDADEGSHPFDRVFTEDTRVFVGSCTQGCTTGSTVLQVTASSNSGTQGEGRYLVNTNSSKAITSGTLTGAGSSGGRQPAATFAGTSFPVSVFLETAQVIPTQSNSMNPGTVAVSIATAGVPTGFATSTAALPGTSGVACVSDVAVSDQRPLNFETRGLCDHRRQPSADEPESSPCFRRNHCYRRIVRLWFGAKGRHAEWHQADISGHRIGYAYQPAVCGRRHGDHWTAGPDQRLRQCELGGGVHCARKQRGDGDDGSQSSAGSHGSYADGSKCRGYQLQRQLCCDEHRAEHAGRMPKPVRFQAAPEARCLW